MVPSCLVASRDRQWVWIARDQGRSDLCPGHKGARASCSRWSEPPASLCGGRRSGARSTRIAAVDREERQRWTAMSLYALSENGDLAAVSRADSTRGVEAQHACGLQGPQPLWLISESPLIDGNKLIVVTPGGRGAGIVALEKTSGKEIWRSLGSSDGAGYASCVIADVHGVPNDHEPHVGCRRGCPSV
jgi:hypothetical protein